MKHTKILYIFIILFTCSYANLFEDLLHPHPPSVKHPEKKASCAITYKLESWRRLGDNIITYCKAKYFSYTYNIPLLYKPFPYSDQFELHHKETIVTEAELKKYSKRIPVNKAEDIENALKSGQSIIFESHFLTETPWLYGFSREHMDFEQEIKKMFTPLLAIELLPRPPSVVPIAVHVRKGGGFDRPLASAQEYTIDESVKGIYLKKENPEGSYAIVWPLLWPAGIKYSEEIKKIIFKANSFSDYTWPIKFPPDQYYIDQIKELADMLPGKNLLIYLFTDDPNPEAIMQRYSKALENYPRIIFSYRQAGNHHTKNVLQDFFAITQCDCLISASSSFAHAAQLLGNHSILMMPAHALLMPDKIFINKVAIFGVNNAHDYDKRQIFFNEKKYKIK